MAKLPFQVIADVDREVISVRVNNGASDQKVDKFLKKVRTVYGMNGQYNLTGSIKDGDSRLFIYYKNRRSY